MSSFIVISLFFVCLVLLSVCANAISVHYLSNAGWDGVEVYISVKREAIQKKLDAFHKSVSNECNNGPKLYIPEVPVLHDLQHRDYHPLYIEVGYSTSHDFEDYLQKNANSFVLVSSLEVSVTIPLLASTPKGPPVYALALGKFYKKSQGDIPKVNAIYPYIPVDEIKMDAYGAVVRNGSEEMKLSFSHFNHSCMPPTSIVKKEFDKFVLSDYQFGVPEPDFSFCDRHTFNSEFCAKAERVKCGVHLYAPNICQIWKSKNNEKCATKVDIEKITPGFGDFILTGEDQIKVLASMTFSVNGSIGLKYPCQE